MIVALIDSGIDMKQPPLVSYMWRNPKETPDGIDNDKNGLVDDVYGWDFVEDNPNVQDDFGHGTEMSHLVLQGNPDARLMVLKVFGRGRTAKENDVAKAIDYAVSHGANVINISLTSYKKNQNVTIAIQKALSKGIKVVAAAGNKGQSKPLFPASVPGVLSAIAVDENGKIKTWSNGSKGKEKETVKINIDHLSTYTLGGELIRASGTSSAAAYYSGQLSGQL